MEELGRDKVFERIGSEPTGRAFNSPIAVVDMAIHTANPRLWLNAELMRIDRAPHGGAVTPYTAGMTGWTR